MNHPTGNSKSDFITALRIIYREGLRDAFAHLSARSDDGDQMLFMPRKSPALVLLSVLGQPIRPMHNYSAIFYHGVPLYSGTGQVETPARAAEMAKLLGDARALMLRGHGAVVVGQSIHEVCMLAIFLEESARLQSEAMRLGAPMFMVRDESEKIAKRTFKPSSIERAWDHFAAKCAG